MTEPIQIQHGRYWGKRAGKINKSGDRVFQAKKWGNGTNNGHTPGRGRGTYKNAKLHRLGRNG